MNYKDYFKDKKVTFVGLGENYKALQDAQFLAKLGASVIVADERAESTLASIVKKMRSEPEETPAENIAEELKSQVELVVKKKKKDWRENLTLHFGPLQKEDFVDRDLIIRDISVPLESSYLSEAREKKIPIEVAECLFIKLAPPIIFVGVTGTCGKSTVAAVVNEILKKPYGPKSKERFYLIDPYIGHTPLALLAKVTREDVVMLELPVLLLEEFEKAHISPHVAVITNLLPDHRDHYKTEQDYFSQKAAILKYQTYNNFFIANDAVVDFIKGNFELPFKAKILRTSVHIIPTSWQLSLPYYHIKEDISLAMRVAEVLKVSLQDMKSPVEHFEGLEGRLELVKKDRGVDYYNDTTSAHPYSTETALRCLAHAKNIVLIWGGKDRNVPLAAFLETMPQYISKLVLLPGSGTLKYHRNVLLKEDIKHAYAHSINEAVRIARDNAGRGDIVLFSPGFPPDSSKKSEIDRGEDFVSALKMLM